MSILFLILTFLSFGFSCDFNPRFLKYMKGEESVKSTSNIYLVKVIDTQTINWDSIDIENKHDLKSKLIFPLKPRGSHLIKLKVLEVIKGVEIDSLIIDANLNFDDVYSEHDSGFKYSTHGRSTNESYCKFVPLASPTGKYILFDDGKSLKGFERIYTLKDSWYLDVKSFSKKWPCNERHVNCRNGKLQSKP